ncbi:MAG TPA: hypothetical protein PLN06_11290 [Bacteroidales bacterium]|nr:hypothetical protein [Bacteroidales bacterium]
MYSFEKRVLSLPSSKKSQVGILSVSKERNTMNADFPDREHFLDFSGKKREFEYLVHENDLGYLIRAKETKDIGYEFHAFSENNPYHALGEIRQKIRKRLSTRYLQKEGGKYHLYHDEAKGHISYGGVVIDGIFIPFEHLNEMIQTYEGFHIEIKIKGLEEE